MEGSNLTGARRLLPIVAMTTIQPDLILQQIPPWLGTPTRARCTVPEKSHWEETPLLTSLTGRSLQRPYLGYKFLDNFTPPNK